MAAGLPWQRTQMPASRFGCTRWTQRGGLAPLARRSLAAPGGSLLTSGIFAGIRRFPISAWLLTTGKWTSGGIPVACQRVQPRRAACRGASSVDQGPPMVVLDVHAWILAGSWWPQPSPAASW
ncbi:unnamed protein product [Polarella glacialis]|uniref:Uncharacterized protein n=1 Tax=Polarella glacialis TaxID=89957 RepID=A0A813FNB5_POLGL|nr:unnamed protein product [Polarella glacialis]